MIHSVAVVVARAKIKDQLQLVQVLDIEEIYIYSLCVLYRPNYLLILLHACVYRRAGLGGGRMCVGGDGGGDCEGVGGWMLEVVITSVQEGGYWWWW